MNVAPLRPSASLMPDVSAVSVSPTRAAPLMVGAPVAGVFTLAVASLVKVSALLALSVKLTFTLMNLPPSAATSMYVNDVAPGMSVSVLPSLRIHW